MCDIQQAKELGGPCQSLKNAVHRIMHRSSGHARHRAAEQVLHSTKTRSAQQQSSGARTKEVRLYLALRLIQRVAEHVGLDRHVLNLQHVHHALDAVAAKHAEQTARASNQTRLDLSCMPTGSKPYFWRLPGNLNRDSTDRGSCTWHAGRIG